MKVDAAIIGGTGIGDRLRALGGRNLLVPTPFGPLRGLVVEGVLVVARHAAGHSLPPHAVRFDAIADGLRRLGVKGCFSTAAVGSLVPAWTPGTIAVVSDLLELTGRQATLHRRAVKHVPMDDCFPLAGVLRSELENAGLAFEREAVYVGMDGPRYETPAEIRMLQGLGGHVVGMTASTEAIAMREAGVPYGCLAVVTNLGCGLGGDIDHEAVGDVMAERAEDIIPVLRAAARRVSGD